MLTIHTYITIMKTVKGKRQSKKPRQCKGVARLIQARKEVILVVLEYLSRSNCLVTSALRGLMRVFLNVFHCFTYSVNVLDFLIGD